MRLGLPWLPSLVSARHRLGLADNVTLVVFPVAERRTRRSGVFEAQQRLEPRRPDQDILRSHPRGPAWSSGTTSPRFLRLLDRAIR